MLGLTHGPAAELAARLVDVTPAGLNRVFYSDAGSTATEIALKMAFQYWRQQGGQHARRTSFIGLADGYHGDTIGAVSVGGIDLFHGAYEPLLFQKRSVPAGDARRAPGGARTARRGDGGRDRRAARAGRRRHPRPAGRLSATGPRALRPVRRAPDLRRGGDRVRADGDDVRLRAGARLARLPLPRQGPDERLHAARGDPDHRSGLRGLPRRARGVPDLLPRPHVHRQPARLRGGDRQPRRCSRRRRRCSTSSRRSTCSTS